MKANSQSNARGAVSIIALAAALGMTIAEIAPAGAAPYIYGYGDTYAYARVGRYSDDAPRRSWRRNLRRDADAPVRKRAKTTEAAKQAKPAPPPLKGPLLISVSIGRQRLTVFDEGKAVAEAPISTGMKGHATPTGVFSVIQKERFHRSNIYSGAPMPFMQRITWSGIALHAGALPGYPASHGCIRLPHEFAVRLFGLTKSGARVVIAREAAAPSAFEHAKLFVMKKPEPPADPQKTPDGQKPPSADMPTSDAKPDAKPAVTTGAAPAKDAATPSVAVIKTAAAGVPIIDATTKPLVAPPVAAAPRPLRPGPVSVFVSRKEGKVFVRKGFEPIFDAPVAINQPEKPLGTHVFSANQFKDDGVTPSWFVVSVPDAPQMPVVRTSAKDGRHNVPASAVTPPTVSSASEALDRIVIPQAALDRITEMMGAGASLIVSDQGLGYETGKETDFVVLTR